MPDPAETTRLLNRLSDGDDSASATLWSEIHGELRSLARSHMEREGPEHTLQPTALVHEAWLRLIDARHATWKSRGHFYSMASKVMRSLLIDHARRKKADKRGGRHLRVALEDRPADEAGLGSVDVEGLHDALVQLEQVDVERARILELRYFGGLSIKEISETMRLPVRTVERRLAAATGWIRQRMSGETGD